MTSFYKIDPIVSELLKAGISTYKKHFKAYIVLNIVSISAFAIILGFLNSIHTKMDVFNFFTQLFQSYQEYTQTMMFYTFIGLLVTIFTYYLTFRGTLRSGELGLEIDTPWRATNQFLIILLYDLIVFLYLLIWVFFFRELLGLIYNNKYGFTINFDLNYTLQFMAFIATIIVLMAFFLFVVKMSYFIYMLDEYKVPTQALDPIIFLFGFLFGLMILFLNLLNIAFPILVDVSIIITFLTPGTLIMPILGYSMAHLKVASTLLGFEPLFEKGEPPAF